MKVSPIVMPRISKTLKQMGNQIKLARLRRNLTSSLVCERAGISRATLWQIEKGSPTVSMGAYASVLMALNGLDKDLLKIASDDELGRTLQDMKITTRNRATNK